MPALLQDEIPSVANARTFISIGVVMMGAAMFGADQNNYGLAYGLKSFGEHWCPTFKFTDVDCSSIADMDDQPGAWNSFIIWGLNLVTIGMCAGALIPGPILANKLGRRMTISIGGLVCFFGCLLASYLSASSVAIYYIGRFVTGFGCGIACFVLPMYNAEVSTLAIRGTTGSLFQFMVVVGGVVAIVALGFKPDWKQGFLIPGYFGLAVGVLAWTCPESPRYLCDRFGKDRARPALQAVRQGDVERELEFMDQCLQEEKALGQVSYVDLFTKPGLRKRLFVACWLQIAQQLTGVNAFLGYQSDIFQAAGYDADQVNNLNPPGPAMIVQIVFVFGCVLGLFLVDSKFGGRKCQLLAASLFMGPPLILAAIVQFADAGHPESPLGKPLSYKIVAYCVWVFSFGFQMAWGIIPWFYPAELFAMQERERALSISTLSGFLINAVIGVITRPIFNASRGAMFLTFGLLNITNVIFVTFMMKETKGIPIEDIPALFDGSEKPTKSPSVLNTGKV